MSNENARGSVTSRDTVYKNCVSLAQPHLDLTDGIAKLWDRILNGVQRNEVVPRLVAHKPHCVDAIIEGGVQLVINTTEGAQAIADSYSIRRSALIHNIPHYTTMAGAQAALSAIEAMAKGSLEVAPLQAYFEKSF